MISPVLLNESYPIATHLSLKLMFSQISPTFQLVGSPSRPISNLWSTSAFSFCHLSSLSVRPCLLPLYLTVPLAICPHFFFLMPSSTLTYSFSIKGRTMPWGSFVITPRGLWGGRGKEGGKKEGKEAGPESLPYVCRGKRIMGLEQLAGGCQRGSWQW